MLPAVDTSAAMTIEPGTRIERAATIAAMTRLLHELNPLRWRRMTLVMVAWALLTLGGAVYGYWSIEHTAACTDASGTGPFCRYRVFTDAVQAAIGPLALYAAGTVGLGLAWLWTMPSRPACPNCGSLSRTEIGVCRKCAFDPFAAPADATPMGQR